MDESTRARRASSPLGTPSAVTSAAAASWAAASRVSQGPRRSQNGCRSSTLPISRASSLTPRTTTETCTVRLDSAERAGWRRATRAAPSESTVAVTCSSPANSVATDRRRGSPDRSSTPACCAKRRCSSARSQATSSSRADPSSPAPPGGRRYGPAQRARSAPGISIGQGHALPIRGGQRPLQHRTDQAEDRRPTHHLCAMAVHLPSHKHPQPVALRARRKFMHSMSPLAARGRHRRRRTRRSPR